MEAGTAQVIVIGAGASGMMCAIEAGRRGRQVLVLDHGKVAGAKIRISGGGRCNFTNREVGAGNFVSRNPHFSKSALSRYIPADFLELIEKHRIPFEERSHGQLFCLGSADQIVRMLETECAEAGVTFQLGCKVLRVTRKMPESARSLFEVETSLGVFTCQSLVVATGGLSIPKVGATGFGYAIARQFGLGVIHPEPALDGFVFDTSETRPLRELAGISLECTISCNGVAFREAVLFTHTGLSGPASLQASLHWKQGDELRIDLLPAVDLFGSLLRQKKAGNRALVRSLLADHLPGRLAEYLCARYFPSELPLPQVSEKALELFCRQLHDWRVVPSATVGFGKAEVTRGGVDTAELSSKTMEAKKVPGLYFIGEVVDVTGWLGGYNLQWAWASGAAAGQNV